MDQRYTEIIEVISRVIDGVGVLVIVLGAISATIAFLFQLRTVDIDRAYRTYRHTLGRAILLGLEFLVAGDIIRTVAVEPTLLNVAILGGIVLIRTFLSFSLQLELEGRWPWQPKPETVKQPLAGES